MTTMSAPKITVEKDYDGYFERLVRSWVDRKKETGESFNNSRIKISSGPYRPYAVSYKIEEDTNTICLDFYSALRTGFGELGEDEIDQLVELL